VKFREVRSYECATSQHSACDGSECGCSCHPLYPHWDDDDYWEEVEPPDADE